MLKRWLVFCMWGVLLKDFNERSFNGIGYVMLMDVVMW